jgi:hypothetical protein
MQGIFIRGARPASKRAVKEAIASDPRQVSIEATSWFGNEYGGPLPDAPAGTITFVGPDPHRDRRFYGSIAVTNTPDGGRMFRVR